MGYCCVAGNIIREYNYKAYEIECLMYSITFPPQVAQGSWEDVFFERTTNVFTRPDMYNVTTLCTSLCVWMLWHWESCVKLCNELLYKSNSNPFTGCKLLLCALWDPNTNSKSKCRTSRCANLTERKHENKCLLFGSHSYYAFIQGLK